jgi:hypothetical protein
MNVEAKLVRKVLFIVIKQYLTWFLKYVIKAGRETVACNCVKKGSFFVAS